MAGWRRRRRAEPAAESAGEQAEKVQERVEALIEGTAKVAELAEDDRAAASLSRPQDHAEALAAGAWHGTADMPGSELPEAFDAFSGIFGAVVGGFGMAARDAVLRENARHKRQKLLHQQQQPTSATPPDQDEHPADSRPDVGS